MKKTTFVSPPIAVMFPQRKMMYVGYNGNGIQIHFSAPCSYDYIPIVVDTSDTPPAARQDELLVRNGDRFNRIVASYSPGNEQLTIRHCKRIYSIKLPPSVREIYCGGRSLYIV